MSIWSTQPTHEDLLRFADDGGRIPDRERCVPIVVGATLRIKMPPPGCSVWPFAYPMFPIRPEWLESL